MIIGIDASNIRMGGGLTHLFETLGALDPMAHGIRRIILWAGRHTLDHVAVRDWLVLEYQPELDGPLLPRLMWQRWRLDRLVRTQRCNVLFVPGGTYFGQFTPFVTFSQNLLPFAIGERRRFRSARERLRYFMLQHGQTRTFRLASGIIFPTRTAHQIVENLTGPLPGTTKVVPYGISDRFLCAPRETRPLSACTSQAPFRWLYVSGVNWYKHQWHVAEAVSILRRRGLPVTLDMVGPANPPALRRLEQTLNRLDPARVFIRYHGPASYEMLHTYYRGADGFIFASTCETFGQTLVEAMCSGLPVACSRHSVMPEILQDAGVYFDPENPDAIARTLQRLIKNMSLRERCAHIGHEKAKAYTWSRCARDTFSFITGLAREKSDEMAPSRIAPLSTVSAASMVGHADIQRIP